MFKKLLSKLVGKTLAPVVDEVVVDAIDKATHGAASKGEKVVKALRGK